jgi:hypothetical protein
MGHVTFLADERNIARERADQFHRRLLDAIGHPDGL